MTCFEKLKDPRWQRKRLKILERDGFKCCDCGGGDDTLHVHHCHYEKGNPWDCDDRMLMTLCEKCHERRQEVESKIKRLFGILLAQEHISCLDPLLVDMGELVDHPNGGILVVNCIEYSRLLEPTQEACHGR